MEIYSDPEEVYYMTVEGEKRSTSLIRREDEEKTPAAPSNQAVQSQILDMKNKNENLTKRLILAHAVTFFVAACALGISLYQLLLQSSPDANNNQHVDENKTVEDEGWVLILKRGQMGNAEDYFAKNFDAYERGFGQTDSEYWIGLRRLHNLTKYGKWELRVTFVTWSGQRFFATFRAFQVGPSPRYQLNIGEFDEDSNTDARFLLYSNNQGFSTMDLDQDGLKKRSCSQDYGKGGWWFDKCHKSNFAGLNRNPGSEPDKEAIQIYVDGEFDGELKYAQEAEMKMRSINN
eukprot:GFUD01032849.1.p1 GENE.GFUD01032849.1~~GFUD01032849.1.p1  ORF type:complete len:290 (-),score=63.10 GFUD01032849.1:20-889(-)